MTVNPEGAEKPVIEVRDQLKKVAAGFEEVTALYADQRPNYSDLAAQLGTRI